MPILLLLIIVLGVRYSGYGMDTDGSLTEEDWPTSVPATLDHLIRTLPKQEKEKLRAMDYDDLYLTHFGLGMYIRNNYGLWRGNEALIKDACRTNGLIPYAAQADQAADAIVRALWRRLQGPHA